MKKFFIYLAAMGMMMTSCQKDEELSKDTFTATTENSNDKTHLNGMNLKWDDEGESIMVIGMNNGFYAGMTEYVATSVTNDNTCATFACREGEEVNAASYQIYYPATMVTANNTLVLPAEQEYVENSVKGFPMVSLTENHVFQFTNLCGIFRLRLQKDDVAVRRITITTDKAVNGNFYVSTNAEGKYQFAVRTANNDAEKTVMLYCGDGVSIDELTDFNIYLPAGTYGTFDITITATDGSKCVKSLNAGSTFTIVRNERVTLVREGEELEFVSPVSFDYVNGLFTVDRYGKQVYFAKGNLQNINGEWRFAEHQYDYLGAYSDTAWDLFGWSSDNTNSNFGMSTLTYNSLYFGNFVDWGTQIGDGQTWYTLNSDEFSYVFSSRADAASKRSVGTVTIDGNEIHGFILLPDTWTLPAGLIFNSGFNDYESWSRNQYTATQWEQMEAAGAVFLPAASCRGGMSVGNDGRRGYYWSSTPSGEFSAYYQSFDDHRIFPASSNANNLYNGLSVRLVKDYHGN